MKTFKLVDALISGILIIVFTSLAIMNGRQMIFYPYFIVGGWQVISMIIHEINKWFVAEGSVRRFYHHVALWMFVGFLALVLIAAGIPGYFMVIYLYFLLVITPFMAIFYTALCFIEWKESFPKPMAKLNY